MQATRNIRPGSRLASDHGSSPALEPLARPTTHSRAGTDPMIGEVLGKYRLTEKLGRGGMAEVYRAEHVLIGGQFAVKVLLPSVSRNHSMIQRLFNEARITATIGHPGIVKTFDFGYNDGGRAYLVMEYLAGESLHLRLKKQETLPVATVLGHARQITSALKAAHDAGIIHRDLKPANVFLVEDAEVVGGERARILDFGIAKASEMPNQGHVTQTGVVIGTPDYMSPEQCRAEPNIDHRTDLYSLGCMMFRMLTGRTPFGKEDDYHDLYDSHMHAIPPEPRVFEPSLPEPVNALIMRLLEKDPNARYADAQALLVALDQIASQISGPIHHGASHPSGQVAHMRGSSPHIPVAYPGGVTAQGSDTTLSRASVSMAYTPPPPARRSLRWLFPVALLVAAAGALAVVIGMSDDGPALVGDESVAGVVSGRAGAPGEAADGPGAAVVLGLPEADPSERTTAGQDETADGGDQPGDEGETAAAPIVITIESDPPGADVYQMPQGVRVGTTPVALERRPLSGELVFVLKKPGFSDVSVAANAGATASYATRLVARPEGADADKANDDDDARARNPNRRGKRTGRRTVKQTDRRGKRGQTSKPKGGADHDMSNTVTLDPFSGESR